MFLGAVCTVTPDWVVTVDPATSLAPRGNDGMMAVADWVADAMMMASPMMRYGVGTAAASP
jgi:hypothetical protein